MSGFVQRALVLSAILLVMVSVLSGPVGASLSAPPGPVTASHDGVAADQPAVKDVNGTGLPGNGTAQYPYEVANISDLQAIDDNLTAQYQIVADIDASSTARWNNGNGFTPIGNSTHYFNGTLDGNGHTITGLTINRSEHAAVFSNNGGVIRNVSFSDVDINGAGHSVAGVTLSNQGTIRGVSVTGNLSGASGGGISFTNANNSSITYASTNVNITAPKGLTGGIVAFNSDTGIIRNAQSDGFVSGRDLVGGLVGSNKGTLSHVSSATTVTADGGIGRIGGLVGSNNQGTIRNAVASGDVQTNLSYVGGLVGDNWIGNITNATASGNVTGKDRVGGLVGETFVRNNKNSIIQNVSANGTVSGSKRVGGLIGNNYQVTVQNAAATGSVNGTATVGGLVGLNRGTLIQTFAAGPVSGTTQTGGLTGSILDNGVKGTVKESYWDASRTKQTTTAGNATGLITAEMQGTAAQSNMTALHFETVWQTQPGDYPKLIPVNRSAITSPLPEPSPKLTVTTDTPTSTVGTPITGTVAAEYTGDTLTATLQDDGQVVASQPLTLNASGATQFKFSTATLDPDTYVVTVTDQQTGIAASSQPIDLHQSEDTNQLATVSFEPNQSRINHESKHKLLVNNTGPIGAYEFTLSLQGDAGFEIQDINLNGNPEIRDISIPSDRQNATATAILANIPTNTTEDAQLATIRLDWEGGAPTDIKEVTLNASVTHLADKNGTEYSIDNRTATATVETFKTDAGPGDVTGNGNAATDVDGDGAYEDINGDGTANVLDVQSLFGNLDADGITGNTAFDMNGDSRVDILDVQALFAEV